MAAAPSRRLSAGGCAGDCGGRWMNWRSRSSAPPRSWRRPFPTGRAAPGQRGPDGQPARSRCPADPQGAIGRPVEFGFKAQVADNDDGVVLDYSVEYGAPRTARSPAAAIERISRRAGSVPRAATADRGYGQPAVERDQQALGVRTVAGPRQATISAARRTTEHSRASAASSSGHRIGRADQLPQAHLRLGPHPADGRHGAAIWCGHGVFATTWSRSANLTA